MPKEKTTIDDLAVMMKEGFDEAKKERDKLLVRQVAIEEQVKNCATKDDLKDLEDRMDNKIDKVLTAVDAIAKKHEDHEIEHVSNQAAHDRFEERTTHLEKHTGLKAPTTA